MNLTVIIEREGAGYVSLCPELDVASQGDTVGDARDNLREAIELFFECVSAGEVRLRRKALASRLRTRQIQQNDH